MRDYQFYAVVSKNSISENQPCRVTGVQTERIWTCHFVVLLINQLYESFQTASILEDELWKVEHSGLFHCHTKLRTCNGCGYRGMEPMAVEHAPTDIGNKAGIFVNITVINAAAPPSGRGRPRGRGWGRSMCARVLAAMSSSDKRKRQISPQRILNHHVSKVTVKSTL